MTISITEIQTHAQAGLPSTDSQIPSGSNIASGKQNFPPITFVVVIQDIGTKIKKWWLPQLKPPNDSLCKKHLIFMAS